MSVMIDVDHRRKLGAARDQRQRPTCLAFAASAAHEASRASPAFLSTEFLFYFGAQRSHKDPSRGLTSTAVSDAMQSDGQPDEVEWPYLDKTPAASAWQPPSFGGPSHTADLVFVDRTVTQVRKAVLAGSPVLLLVSLTTAMYNPRPGGFIQPGKNDSETARRHALVAVGAGRLNRRRFILVRNSWGSDWGVAGHGWLAEPYLAKCLITTATIV